MKYYIFKASAGGIFFNKQRPIKKGLRFSKYDFTKQCEVMDTFEVKGKNGVERANKWIKKALNEGFTVEVYTGRDFGRCQVVDIL